MLFFLRFLPKNLVSYITGVVVRMRFPRWIAWLPCGAFIRMFGIDMQEASLPLSQYQSIEDVFTRKLAPGTRAIDGGYCAPADGVVTAHGEWLAGRALQVKGLTYSVHELIGDDSPRHTLSERGWYQTIYLAPHNYHRVHSPVSGKLVELKYIPGTLWPVNRQSTERVSGLFCANERLIFKIKSDQGFVYVAMVGAFNVGRIAATAFPEWTTNDLASLRKPVVRTQRFERGIELSAGDDMGVFMLGSTVVTLFEDTFDNKNFKEYAWRQPIQVGESLLNRSESEDA